MSERCPCLGLQYSRKQALLLASPHHRCYASGRPERVPTVFQVETCLTAEHRRCSRLVRFAKTAEVATEAPSFQALSLPQETSPPPHSLDDSDATILSRPPPVVRMPWARPSVRRTDLQAIGKTRGDKARRSVTVAEVSVLGLGLGIVLAFLFIGYAAIFRLQIGPGMEVPTVVALGPTQVLPTLVPTFTPTPLPVTDALSTPGPPTPIPEPTLPAPTPVVRLPSTSPPTRLVIPGLDLDIPVLTVGVKSIRDGRRLKVVWADVPHAGGFHGTSAYPGNPGNTVINGHRDILGAVFRHLNQVDVGDEIILYVGEEAYVYNVTEMLVVPETFASADQRAENLRLIGYLPEERLTLVTCTPVGLATHRLLVIAKPPTQLIPDMPEAGTDNAP